MTFRDEFICFRALKKIPLRTVWKEADVSLATLVKFEKGEKVSKRTEEKLRNYYESKKGEQK